MTVWIAELMLPTAGLHLLLLPLLSFSFSLPASMGKNKPLRQVAIRWCSQLPLTVNQLQSKREEFWDTAPAFDGRIEIWNALKAAADFMEKNDCEMAQAIVDGADIILPTGE